MPEASDATSAHEVYSSLSAAAFAGCVAASIGPHGCRPDDVLELGRARAAHLEGLFDRATALAGFGPVAADVATGHRWWDAGPDFDVGAWLVLCARRLVRYPVDFADASAVRLAAQGASDIQAAELLHVLALALLRSRPVAVARLDELRRLLDDLAAHFGTPSFAAAYRIWRAGVLPPAVERATSADIQEEWRGLARYFLGFGGT
ncbi:MAG: hypothetical protein ACRD0D_04790 [Acidimicrobiales bacterium]